MKFPAEMGKCTEMSSILCGPHSDRPILIATLRRWNRKSTARRETLAEDKHFARAVAIEQVTSAGATPSNGLMAS